MANKDFLQETFRMWGIHSSNILQPHAKPYSQYDVCAVQFKFSLLKNNHQFILNVFMLLLGFVRILS